MCKYPIEQFDFDSVTLHVKIVFFSFFFCLYSLAHIHSFRFVRMNYEYLTGIERLVTCLCVSVTAPYFFFLFSLQKTRLLPLFVTSNFRGLLFSLSLYMCVYLLFTIMYSVCRALFFQMHCEIVWKLFFIFDLHTVVCSTFSHWIDWCLSLLHSVYIYIYLVYSRDHTDYNSTKTYAIINSW